MCDGFVHVAVEDEGDLVEQCEECGEEGGVSWAELSVLTRCHTSRYGRDQWDGLAMVGDSLWNFVVWAWSTI